MSLKTKPITKDSPEAAKAEQVLKGLFPPEELMPFWYLLRGAKKQCVDFLAYYDEDTFVGLSYSVTNEDVTLIMYLAVDGTIQSKGYGSRILTSICERYPDNRIALDIEELDEGAANYEQRVKRKAFYEKNGFVSTGLFLSEGKELYEIMSRGGAVRADDYRRAYRKLAGPFLYPFFKPTIIPASVLN